MSPFEGLAVAGTAALAFWRLEAAFFTFVLLLPFLSTGANSLSTSFMALAVVLGLVRGRIGFRPASPDVPLILLGIILVASALGSVAGYESLPSLATWAVYLMLYFIFARAGDSPSRLALVFSALALSATAVSLVGIWQFLGGVETPASWIDLSASPSVRTRVYSVFDNPNMLAGYLALALPATAFHLLHGKRRAARITLGIFLIIMTLCLAFTFSRGGWIAATFSLLLFGAIKERRLLPVLALALVAAAVFLPRGFLERAITMVTFEDTSFKFRTSVWVATLRLIKDNWLTGVGLGPAAFLAVYPDYLLAGTPAAHTHNLYLELLAETGVFGLAALLWAILNLVKTALRKALRPGYYPAMLAMLAAAILGQAFHGVTDNIWYSPKNAMMFWIFSGLIVSVGRLVAGDEGDST